MQANDNFAVPPANPALSPEAIAACDWACTIPADVSIVKHPYFQEYFGKLSQDQMQLAAAEMERRGWAAAAEADALEAEGKR